MSSTRDFSHNVTSRAEQLQQYGLQQLLNLDEDDVDDSNDQGNADEQRNADDQGNADEQEDSLFGDEDMDQLLLLPTPNSSEFDDDIVSFFFI